MQKEEWTEMSHILDLYIAIKLSVCVCVFFLSLFLLPETSGTLKPCFLPSRPLGGGGPKKETPTFFFGYPPP